ncbi:MAG: hypothetical protein IJR62_04895, partial [Lachnospiraceae bacterium]|nr:hypothetical protein [Lachnospiraceae bacterium]
YGFSSSSVATDIYSVGILMNKLLTGKLLSEQTYAGPLAGIIEKCTQLEPSRRYKDISQLDKDLARHTGKKIQIPAAKWKYLPPGFRSGNIVIMFIAFLGYFLMLSVTLTMTAKTQDPRLTWANRLSATAAFLGITHFTGNYLDCQSYLPLSRSNNLFLRLTGILLWDVVIFFGCVIVGMTFS